MDRGKQAASRYKLNPLVYKYVELRNIGEHCAKELARSAEVCQVLVLETGWGSQMFTQVPKQGQDVNTCVTRLFFNFFDTLELKLNYDSEHFLSLLNFTIFVFEKKSK